MVKEVVARAGFGSSCQKTHTRQGFFWKLTESTLLPGWSWWWAQCWLAVVVERGVVVGQR